MRVYDYFTLQVPAYAHFEDDDIGFATSVAWSRARRFCHRGHATICKCTFHDRAADAGRRRAAL